MYQKSAEKSDFGSNFFWQAHYLQLKESIQGTEQEKEEKLRKRIVKFFGGPNLQTENYFNKRKDVELTNSEISFQTRKILLFGVDYLQQENTKEYFKQFNTEVHKLNDSHALVIFNSQAECLRALSAKSLGKHTFKSFGEVMEKGKDGWVQLQSYSEMVFERKLFARFWSNLDKIEEKDRTQYYASYILAKKQFFKSFAQKLQNPEPLYEFSNRYSKAKKKQRNLYQQNRREIVYCCQHFKGKCQRSSSRSQDHSRSRSRQKRQIQKDLEEYCRKRKEFKGMKVKEQPKKPEEKHTFSELLNYSDLRLRNSSSESKGSKGRKAKDVTLDQRSSRSFSVFQEQFDEKLNL